ncbi:MAG: PEBP family protein [Parcubacteria group bacterium Gr01-1014_29]|nr:MAG: PEBP family protein [Parcubacteria group bacterium Gr01-1014_29]
MNISSFAFQNTTPIPAEFTCDGENKNPTLTISDVPAGTKSLALIVDDPDAPGGIWVHWTVWNMSPATREIKEDSVPPGAIQGKTNRANSYHGPCPPSGTHRYFFKLYALDTLLNIPLTSEARAVEEAMKGHIVADAKLMGTYSRN